MKLDKESFTKKARERFETARKFWRIWRIAAVDDYAFVSGNQWTEDDRQILEDEDRPAVTFNYSEKMIDAVIGAEVSNRQEVAYRPRGMEDAPLAELMTNAAKYVRQECDADDEESDAFKDTLICGMGWTHTRMDYDSNPDGDIVVDRIDPLEMFSDPSATKPGLADRQYNFRLWWAPLEEARREWPDAIFAEEGENETGIDVIHTGHRYEDETSIDVDRHKDHVRIRLYECVEREPFYRYAVENQMQEISEETFRKLKSKFDEFNIPYVRQFKKVYYRAFFSGETLLDVQLSPCQKGFTFNCITGKRERNSNTWYGLTRVMKDPQRWANKWLSQILHIINTNAKGGLLAETGAFVDPHKAMEEWAKPDSVTLMNEGAISGQKIMPKPIGTYPQGLDHLMQFALNALPMVTGINLEALGLANREQAGVLEAARKQAAYGLLAPLFDSMKHYRKIQGRVLLAFIHEFISDGRLIRIEGQDVAQYLQLAKAPNAMEYDIIVDSAPQSPDVQQKTWETLMGILPSLMKAGIPLPPDLLDFTPLPQALKAKWKAFIQQGQQQQQQQMQQMQQQMQQMSQQMQQLQQENQALKSDQQTQMATLQQKAQLSEAELLLKKQQQDAEAALAQEKADREFALRKQEQDRKFALAAEEASHEIILKRQIAEADAANKEYIAHHKSTNGDSHA